MLKPNMRALVVSVLFFQTVAIPQYFTSGIGKGSIFELLFIFVGLGVAYAASIIEWLNRQSTLDQVP